MHDSEESLSNEPGVLRFDLAVAEGSAAEFTLNEVYTDQAAFDVRFQPARSLGPWRLPLAPTRRSACRPSLFNCLPRAVPLHAGVVQGGDERPERLRQGARRAEVRALPRRMPPW